MEFSARCHIDLIVPPRGSTKPLLRQALRRKGAPEQVWNAPKRGFNNPLAGLLRRSLRPLCEEVFERSQDIFEPYLDPTTVKSLWLSHVGRKVNHAYALWPLLTFAIWRSQLEGFELNSLRTRETGWSAGDKTFCQ
jgi:asparagine synthase (glutamine-hydrolysing)